MRICSLTEQSRIACKKAILVGSSFAQLTWAARVRLQLQVSDRRKYFRKGTSVVEGSIEIGMNEGIKKDTMIITLVLFRFLVEEGDGLREVGQTLRSGL